MPKAFEQRTNEVRSIFVSDVHLGCRYSQADKFCQFLRQTHPEYIYLVGDFIDGWRLKKRWHWQDVYMQIFRRLSTLASHGTQICYTPGNHDAFLRAFHHDFGLVTIADEFIHVGADNRQYVVVHGDQFDNVEKYAKWLSMIGAGAYEFLIWINNIVNRLRRRLHLADCRLSSRAKVLVKNAVRFISDFEQRLIEVARRNQCDGVICGHIHVPRISRMGDVLYCNTGDWVEHCTALVEYTDGQLELVDYSRPCDRSRTTAIPHRRTPEVEPVDASLAIASSMQEVVRFLTMRDAATADAA